MSAAHEDLPAEERHLLAPGRESDRRLRALDPEAPVAVLRALAYYEPEAVLDNPVLPLLEVAGDWRWDTLPPPTFRALASRPNFPERGARWLLEAGRRAWAEGRGVYPGYGFEPDAVIGNPALATRFREQLLVAWWERHPPSSRRELAQRLGSPVADLLERAAWKRRSPPQVLSPEELELLWDLGGFAHQALAGHPGCPRARALALLDSPSEFVRTLIARRPECAAEAAERFARTLDLGLARGLAQNPGAAPEVLAQLVDVEPAREALAEHPRLPPGALTRLAALASPGSDLARHLLLRRDLSAELRAALRKRPAR